MPLGCPLQEHIQHIARAREREVEVEGFGVLEDGLVGLGPAFLERVEETVGFGDGEAFGQDGQGAAAVGEDDLGVAVFALYACEDQVRGRAAGLVREVE